MAIPRKKTSTPEIPLTSTSDVAFLLLIFFLVAASNAVDKGVPLDLPSTTKQQNKQQSQNIEIGVSKDAVTFAGETLKNESDLGSMLAAKLKNIHEPALRVVMVTASPEVDYQRWTKIIGDVEAAGGIPAPQMEEIQDRKNEEGPAAPAPSTPDAIAPPAGGGAGK